MPYIKKRIKPWFLAVFGVRNGVPAVCSSVPATCGGEIEQILEFSATHRFEEAAYSSLQKIYTSIVTHFPVTTQDNRGFFAGSFGTIGGLV